MRAQAGNRCGYCRVRQEYVPWALEVEHIVPKSKGGTDDEENLLVAVTVRQNWVAAGWHPPED